MGNSEAKRVRAFEKQVREEDFFKAEIIQQGEVPVEERDIETRWKLYPYTPDNIKHYAVLVRDDLAVSFGVAFNNDNTEVIPNLCVLKMTDGKLNHGTLKGETVEDLTISHIVVEYLNQLQKFGNYDKYSNNCIHFTHMFLEHMGECRFMSRRRCYLKGCGQVCLNHCCGY